MYKYILIDFHAYLQMCIGLMTATSECLVSRLGLLQCTYIYAR